MYVILEDKYEIGSNDRGAIPVLEGEPIHDTLLLEGEFLHGVDPSQ